MSNDDSNRVNARLGIYGGRGVGMPLDGIDWFEQLQEPEVDPGDDPLAGFVLSRIIELELEPRGEIKPLYDQPGGSMAHRYAKHVRRDCIVFRKQLAQYLEIKAALAESTDPGENRLLAGCMLAATSMLTAIAERWDDHRDFQAEWSMV